MGLGGCRSSGELTSAILVFSGRCKLVSIHATNTHATAPSIVTIYDNVAASGKKVATLVIPALSGAGSDNAGATVTPTATSLEYDMHGVYCKNGIFAVITTPTGSGNHGFTIEYE